jgi:hypothetical protein
MAAMTGPPGSPPDAEGAGEFDGPDMWPEIRVPHPPDTPGTPGRMAGAGGLAHRRNARVCASCGRSLGTGLRVCPACSTVSQFYDPELTMQVRYREAPPPMQGAQSPRSLRLRGGFAAALLLGVILAIALLLVLDFIH